jgi:hypothetical protein
MIENGIYKNMSNHDYHAASAVSRSSLMHFLKSPYHYWYAKNYPEVRTTTDDMRIGSMVHTLVLEPEKFDSEFFVLPPLNLRTNAGKEELSALKAQHCDKELVSVDMLNQAKEMAWAVRSHELAPELIDGAFIENSIFFTHKTGIQCKSRPDALQGNIVVDLKTARDASAKAIGRASEDYGYFLQAAMCSYALKSIGQELKSFVMIAVEKKKPYAVGVYKLDQRDIEFAETVFDHEMIKLAKCIEDDTWPSYEFAEIKMPPWGMKQYQEEFEND